MKGAVLAASVLFLTLAEPVVGHPKNNFDANGCHSRKGKYHCHVIRQPAAVYVAPAPVYVYQPAPVIIENRSPWGY